jgi:MOSC domain-containing protein
MSREHVPHLAALYRYPVKGLSGERLERVLLTPGATLPFDRAYAIENGPGRFDAEAPRHLPKITFLMLMRNERLATLRSQFDDGEQTLLITRNGKQVSRGQLGTKLGRQLIEQFLAAYMKDDLRGAPRIVQAPGHSFSDVAAKCVHIVNLASVRSLQHLVGRPLDPRRFRANLYLDGLEPWTEFGWLNKHLQIGPAKLTVFARTTRCEATNVDPETGVRDTAVPATLQRNLGHCDLGIYANITIGGELRPGADVLVPV